MKTTFEDEQAGLHQLNLWQLDFWLSPHLWRNFLLNTCPNAHCEAFQGKQRLKYWLEVDLSETEVTLTVHRRGGQVARSIVKWAGPDEAILEDLLVALPSRGRGLATHLLDRAIALSGQRGAKYLAGRVIRKDAERDPGLLAWYRRRGFEVQPVQAAPPVEPTCPLSIAAQRTQPDFETVATIRLNLAHNSDSG